MAMDSKSGNTVLRLWVLLHRVRDTLVLCEDSIFGEYGITNEQCAVLATIKYLGGSVKISDLAESLERSANSVSMIVDRMVKAGLVTRKRDRVDRRLVYAIISSKGEDALKPAIPAGLEFVQKILAPLSNEDKGTLLSLLEIVKSQALEHLNPGRDIAEITKRSITKRSDLMKRAIEYTFTSAPQVKGKTGKKKKVTG